MTVSPDQRSDGGVPKGRTRALVLHPVAPRETRADAGRPPERRLEEARGLALAIDLEVVEALLVPLPRPRPATLLGRGKVDEVADLVRDSDIELVIVDGTLTPVQQRNLERTWKAKVLDRTGLILEIFGARARTKEGRLQVELAHLTYQRSRLVRSWTHLERQRGGFGFLGGPGETQIESDRRVLSDRIVRLTRQLAGVKRTRQLHREARRRVPYPVAVLVGYTNAGKSTLFNRLTDAQVRAESLLFATLDPTMRQVRLPSGAQVILSDTVGFISDLPTELVVAFRATLEEVREADILIHVRDISDPDTLEQKQDVLAVLEAIGIGPDDEAPMIEVLNKIDLVPFDERGVIVEASPRSGEGLRQIPLSALTGEGTGALLQALDDFAMAQSETVEIDIDAGNGAALAWLHRRGQVLSRQESGAGRVKISARLTAKEIGQFEKQFGEAVRLNGNGGTA